MPENNSSPDKMFFTMGEVAEHFGMNISAIRYWEKEFDILKPKRNKKGNRLFTPKDFDNFHLIYHLIKEKGMTLEGAKKQIENDLPETLRKFEVIKKLKNIREELNNLNEAIQILEEKRSME